METLMKRGGFKKKYLDLSFRKAFILTVLVTFAVVAVLSAAGIFGCTVFRNYLLPDPNSVMLKMEYRNEDGTPCTVENKIVLGEEPLLLPRLLAVTKEGDLKPELADVSSLRVSAVKMERGIDRIGPRRRLAYQACGVLMICFPVCLSVTGILLCGFIFYRQKMEKPLALLNRAMEDIASEDLDFTFVYDSRDEMGRLCASFEKMRRVLSENHKALWRMAEERRLLQASVAHDLRNPIAILAGYIEYLQIGLEKGEMPRERLATIVRRLDDTVNRLSQYTESVRYLNRMEDMELCRVPINVWEFAGKMTQDFKILASDADIRLEAAYQLPQRDAGQPESQTVAIDSDVVYRIAENLMRNALGFARQKIRLTFGLEDGLAEDARYFTIEICDDGPGFSKGPQKERGLGLTIVNLLLQKHGGYLQLSDGGGDLPGGASAKAFIKS